MTDRDILYRAVLDSPEDDTLRLVYADALEEGGDPRRAAFVRAQVELSRVPTYDPLWVRRARTGSAPVARSATPRTFELELPEGIEWTVPPFRRTRLPGAIRADNGAAFVAGAERSVRRRYPIEAACELVAIRLPDTRDFPECPWLERLTSLSLVQGAGGPTIREVAVSPRRISPACRRLRVGSQLTTPPTVHAIVRSEVFGRPSRHSVCEAIKAATGGDSRGRTCAPGEAAAAHQTRPLRQPTLVSRGSARTGRVGSRRRSGRPRPERQQPRRCRRGGAGRRPVPRTSARCTCSARARRKQESRLAPVGAGFFAELKSLSLGGNNPRPRSRRRDRQCTRRKAATARTRPAREPDRRSRRKGAGEQPALDEPHPTRPRGSAHRRRRRRDSKADSPYLGGLLDLNLYGNDFSEPVKDRLRKRFGDRELP